VGSQGERSFAALRMTKASRATARDRPIHGLAKLIRRRVEAIPCGRPGSLRSRLWGQASRPNIFCGGYATRSSRGDGVAYPPANI
jgi:hypothetical protein